MTPSDISFIGDPGCVLAFRREWANECFEHMPSQTIFEECYRNRQSAIHHMAYMRTGKVFLILRLLEKAGISLSGKDVFDYGFGAGTFFRYCPSTARLFGVEIDAKNVSAVATMLHSGGHRTVDLQRIAVSAWKAHPLLKRPYDVIICSHVLEHMGEPIALLRAFHECLRPDGAIVALVPINERGSNPHHLFTVDKKLIESWADTAGLKLSDYLEDDPWFYRFQSLFNADDGWKHKLAQIYSLSLGIPASALGHRWWDTISQVFSRLTASKPMQAGFVLRRFS